MPLVERPMHADHVEERLFVYGVARAGTDRFGNPGAGEIRLAAHYGADGSRPIAAGGSES